MSTPFRSRQPAPTTRIDDENNKAISRSPIDWRCSCCDKLLGVCRDGRMHLRFARRHEYFVGFPVVATCCGCGTLNRVIAPAR